MESVFISDEIDNPEIIPYYQIDCLRKNSNHHILPMSISIKDSKTIIETDITGLLPLSLFLGDRKVSRKTAIEIILSYANCLKWCIDHFLDPHSLKCSLTEFYIPETVVDFANMDIYFRYAPNTSAKVLLYPIENLLNEVFSHLILTEENVEINNNNNNNNNNNIDINVNDDMVSHSRGLANDSEASDSLNSELDCIDSKFINNYFTEQEFEILSGWNLANLAEGIELVENFPEIINLNSILSPLHNDVMPITLEERLNSCKVNNNSITENPKHIRIGDSFISKFQFTPFVIVSVILIEFSLILLSFVILRNQNMFTNRYLPVFAVVLILIFCALADMILLFNPKSPIRILSDSKPYPIDPQDCNLFSITEEKTTLLQRSVDKSRIAMLCNGIPGTPQESLGQKAYILVDDFLVGRDGIKVDFKINSLSVGRLHARITRRENSFFIEDLDSRNGTYIDELKIKKKQEYLLPEKCKIRFADQVFYFVAT